MRCGGWLNLFRLCRGRGNDAQKGAMPCPLDALLIYTCKKESSSIPSSHANAPLPFPLPLLRQLTIGTITQRRRFQYSTLLCSYPLVSEYTFFSLSSSWCHSPWSRLNLPKNEVRQLPRHPGTSPSWLETGLIQTESRPFTDLYSVYSGKSYPSCSRTIGRPSWRDERGTATKPCLGTGDGETKRRRR